MTTISWLGVALVGLAVGFLAGLFGKGGSAVATPLLHALGVPAIVAVAAPLPATIPSTLAATAVYWRERLVDRPTFLWSIGVGIPATVAGALATHWVSGVVLVRITDLVIAGLGVRFLFGRSAPERPSVPPSHQRFRLAAVALMVGLAGGLLANSGGFLLAPLYLTVLRIPLKSAFATSLAVASVLAVPGTVVHWALGHIDWSLVGVFALTSVPCSYAGARLALVTRSDVLERIYGAGLAILGVALLALG